MDNNETNNTKKKSGKKIWIIILIVVIIGVAVSVSKKDKNKDQKSDNETTVEETAKEYIKVSVDDLETDLKNNAANAKDKYKGKYVEVTGKLGTIDSDLKYISLKSETDEFDLTGIHCTIKNDDTKETVKTLTTDEIITVKGKITDVGEVLGYSLDIEEIVK